MKSSPLSLALRFGVSVGALVLIVYFMREEVDDAIRIIREGISIKWFLAALVTYLVSLALITQRMRWMFRVQEIHLRFSQAFYLTFLGLFFNLFLPSAVGGDVAKAYYAARYSGRKISSMTAVFQDRLVGFVVMITMALTALQFAGPAYQTRGIRIIVFVFLGLMLAVMAFFFSRRFFSAFSFLKILIPGEGLRKRLHEVYQAVHDYRNHKKALVIALAYSLAGQACFILVHYWAARSLGVAPSLVIFFLLVPLVAIVSMAPSLGGLGVREAGLIFFFKNTMPPERALALSVLVTGLLYGLSFAGGILYSLKGGLKERVIEEIDSEPDIPLNASARQNERRQ